MKKSKQVPNLTETLTPAKYKAPNRLCISTPTVGTVRMEWVNARFGQIIPCSFSLVDMQSYMNTNAPIGYQLADAENLTAKFVVENKFDWFLSIEDDNIPPLDMLVKMNQYMIRGDVPVVSGIYFTKSDPPEPIIYRGMGQGHYADWKLGEKVWADAIPFGCCLISGKLIKAVWNESPEYIVNGQVTRRVFDNEPTGYVDPMTGGWMQSSGTTDLAFFKRVVEGHFFSKAGFPEYEKMEHPYLCDTSIFVRHIDRATGIQYPISLPKDFAEGRITWKEALASF